MKDYTEIIDDPELTWAEKGILSIFYRNSPEFKGNISEIKNMSKNGRDATTSVFHSLAKKGYLIKVTNEVGDRDESGKFLNKGIYWKLATP